MLIGYLCPCPGNRTDRATQRRALAEAGCEQIVQEQPDAKDSGEQPELDGLLAHLRAGDVLVVPRLDSLGRLLPDMVRRVQRLTAAGAGLRSLAEALDAAVQDGQQRRPKIACQRAMGRVRLSSPEPAVLPRRVPGAGKAGDRRSSHLSSRRRLPTKFHPAEEPPLTWPGTTASTRPRSAAC